MKLTELNDRSLPDFLQKSRTPALVAFTAAWSKPSRAMYPVLEELARQYDSVVEFALVDADSSRNSLNHYGVLSIPTYLYFRNGRVVDRFIGALTKEKLTDRLEQVLQLKK
ncbi:thioredoxin family protein [bacterium]|nr:thioredoxin family protein [bacterium]MCB1220034.1 thioredoxin family protein [bacterium]UNM08659.1 MAG: thioredoxin family protein [Planctomycetales bacterium]